LSVRTRRAFSREFKAAVVDRLRTEPVAEVARTYDISVSVLHRWRRDLVSGAQVPRVANRRNFPREFKHSTVARLSCGEPLAEVARLSGVSPDVLRRWWREAMQFGERAFQGYGRTRLSEMPAQAVIIRLSPEEYSRLQEACTASDADSLPGFARSQLLQGSDGPSLRQVEARLERLASRVRELAHLAGQG
jgi:transposase-like protein